MIPLSKNAGCLGTVISNKPDSFVLPVPFQSFFGSHTESAFPIIDQEILRVGWSLRLVLEKAL